MTVKELLLKLKEIMEEERELLLSFPVKETERFERIQEEKRELLLKISSFEVEELEKEKELLKEIQSLNRTISALIVNGISFFEDLERELFGEKTTYTSGKDGNLFKRRV